jgi:hypothetical protein
MPRFYKRVEFDIIQYWRLRLPKWRQIAGCGCFPVLGLFLLIAAIVACVIVFLLIT